MLSDMNPKFDESTLNHFLSSAIPSFSNYPSPHMIPGYHHYYNHNHGLVPSPHNLSGTHTYTNYPRAYYNPVPPHSLFPSIHPLNHPQHPNVCLRPGCVKAGKWLHSKVKQSFFFNNLRRQLNATPDCVD